jgi:selenocysteine-specific elongation factor
MQKKAEQKKNEAVATISLTVGTAGHIDHGKTELVKLLTGCDTDRLPEEKQRGMTIDLGFATCSLPNNRRVGIVDVPGHERFIHNMVAGAAAIDVVLLVVAADDGVMPQTIEHFHIVRMLGIRSGMVAITKTDLVGAERVAEVEEQVVQLLAGSFMEGCAVVPVSSKTGAGFEAFYEKFVAVVDRTAEREASGAFRLHVERSFVLKGLGTIVSGIPCSGKVRLGDSVDLLPRGEKKKVRGIQVYGVDAEEGRAGECLALRLADVSHDDVVRGMVLASPGYFEPTRFVDAKFHMLPGLDRALEPRTAVRFHIGTSDVPGHLVLPDLSPLRPGMETYVQFQLSRPVVAAPDDFFVVRMLSPVRTIGGGYVVAQSNVRMRRSKGEWLDACIEHEQAFKDPADALLYVLEHAEGKPVKLDDAARQAVLNMETAKQYVDSLVQRGSAVELPGGRYVESKAVEVACEEIVGTLNRFHDKHPLSMGFEKKELLRELNGDHHVLDRAMAELVEQKKVVINNAGLQLQERAPSLSASQSVIASKITDAYRKAHFSSSRRDELPALIGAPARVIEPVVDHLVQTGELVEVSDKVILHRDAIEESRRKLTEYLAQHGSLESGAFKDMLSTTRKYSIPVLEYWDAQGLTRRVGNKRVLKEK